MNPGDVIEWVYASDSMRVGEFSECWSSTLQKDVSIGSRLNHILISIDERNIVWLNENGMSYASFVDFQRNHEDSIFAVKVVELTNI